MSARTSTDELFLRKIKAIILDNLENEHFGVNELISKSGIPRYKLIKKLHILTNKTINRFICETRLKKAFELLQDGSMTVSEVAFKVGFRSPAYFNKCFHDLFGYSPGKVREKARDNLPTEFLTLDKPGLKKRTFWFSYTGAYMGSLILIVLILAIALFAYTKIKGNKKLSDLRYSSEKLSVLIIPFRNMTNDTTWNIWQDGIQNNLITSLTNTEELKVRQPESINRLFDDRGITNYSSITPSVAVSVARNLDADVIISGSIHKVNSTIRLNSILIESKTEETIKSFQIDGNNENILVMIDSLSLLLRNSLIMTELNNGVPLKYELTNSVEAFKYYLYGNIAREKYDLPAACNWYLQAIAVDSNFFEAIARLSSYCGSDAWSKQLVRDLYKKRDMMSMRMRLWTNWAYAFNFETINDEIKYLKQLQDLDEYSTNATYLLALDYNRLHQFDKAIKELEKSMALYKKWGSKPDGTEIKWLGNAYHKTGQYRKEKKLYRKAERDLPDDPWVEYRQAILKLSEGKRISSSRYINNFISFCRNVSIHEAEIASLVAQIYKEAGIPDKAAENYRKALAQEPDSTVRLTDLASFLIDNDINIEEGLELADKALEFDPDNSSALACKGWGLYKKGKNEEALEILEQSWELKSFYEYDLYLKIEEVKTAVSN
jgi:AraC-like DNA-binding protein/TolB-like protein